MDGLRDENIQDKLIRFANDTVILIKNQNINVLCKMAGISSIATVENWLDSLSISVEKN